MRSYHDIFPDADAPVMTLDVLRKTGGIPKGSYRFLEYYCTEPGCDCRRVTVVVVNEKQRRKGVIAFGFDGEGPFAGPYLDTSNYQSPFALELLDFFVRSLNSRPELPTRMCRHYRQVRELVDGKNYRGRPFPKAGSIVYRAAPAPDLAAVLEQSLMERETVCNPAAPAGRGGRRKEATPGPNSRPDNRLQTAAKGMARLAELYLKTGSCGSVGILLALQDELRRYLALNPAGGEELASLLPGLGRTSDPDCERLASGLSLLCDALDFYQVEVEGERPGAKQQMQRFQSAVLRSVFIDTSDDDLALAVARIVANSRVKMIPALLEAIETITAADPSRTRLAEPPADDLLEGIARSFAERGVSSPFEGVEEILELFANTDPELWMGLAGALLTAEDPFLREVSALLLFHHEPEFSLGVSWMLGSVDGASIGPRTLRRLIISRNWFPGAIRRNVDRAIGNARRARVECAPLPRAPAMSVHARPLDGFGGEEIQVAVNEGASQLVCSIVLDPEGVGECLVSSFGSPRELDRFLARVKREGVFLERTPEYLDLRVCEALADGAERGKVPNRWLVRIAELLGRDRWRGI